MDIVRLLASPGMVVGCLVGVALAFAIHGFLPTVDLAVLYALLIVGFGVVGLVLAGGVPSKRVRGK